MIDQPIGIGALKLKNRLAMAPVAVYKCTAEGRVTPELCEHYALRAKLSGVGLIITEHSFVAPEGKAKPNQVSVCTDDDIPGLSLLADACHDNGIAAICQISHAGGAARRSVTGVEPVAPSAIVSSQAFTAQEGDGVPQALDEAGIMRIINAFADAAQRVKDAGFDGVELHSAHAYLLDQFYSPLLNVRTDSYGGSLENRIRIHRAVLGSVREAVGPDFVIGMRLGGCDYEAAGATIDDAVEAARMLQDAGADYLSISGGWHAWRRPGHEEPGWFADQAQAIRAAVSIPVLTAGGIKTRNDAERLLQAGVCDIVAVGRPLLKNPAWPDEAPSV